MTLLQSAAAAEVEADTAHEVTVVVFTQATVHEERDVFDGSEILETGDVEALFEAVLILGRESEVLREIGRGEEAHGDEVTLIDEVRDEARDDMGVRIVVSNEGSQGEAAQVKLALKSGEDVREVRAMLGTHRKAEEALRRIPAEEVAACSIDVCFEATDVGAVQLCSITLSHGDGIASFDAADVALVDGSVGASDFAIRSRHSRFNNRTCRGSRYARGRRASECR